MIFTIYHDSDGVIADFDNHAYNLLGCHPDTIGDTKFWEIVKNEPRFWNEIPVIDGAYEYWNQIKHLNPIILTGAPKSDFEFAEKSKKEWWLKHFDYTNVIVCLTKNKPKFVTGPETILIDDLEKNIIRWTKAGGTAIHHNSFDETLLKLHDLKII